MAYLLLLPRAKVHARFSREFTLTVGMFSALAMEARQKSNGDARFFRGRVAAFDAATRACCLHRRAYARCCRRPRRRGALVHARGCTRGEARSSRCPAARCAALPAAMSFPSAPCRPSSAPPLLRPSR